MKSTREFINHTVEEGILCFDESIQWQWNINLTI